jgi:hypothetical protein
LESKCRQCGTHRALPLCDRCVLCVKLISCLFRNISPLPIAKSLHGVSQTTEGWLKADVFHATGATVAKVGSKNSARFVLACSRKARPSGPPTVATTRPSQGLVCTRLLCLGLSRGPRPSDCLNGTLLPQSSGVPSGSLLWRASPRLLPEAWFAGFIVHPCTRCSQGSPFGSTYGGYNSTFPRSRLYSLTLPRPLPRPSSLSGQCRQLRDRLRRATRHSAVGKRCRPPGHAIA